MYRVRPLSYTDGEEENKKSAAANRCLLKTVMQRLPPDESPIRSGQPRGPKSRCVLPLRGSPRSNGLCSKERSYPQMLDLALVVETSPCHNARVHPCGARPTKNPRALVQCCPRRTNVVDQQKRRTFQCDTGCRGERSAHVLSPFRVGESNLIRPTPYSAQRRNQRNSKMPRCRPCE